MKVTDEMVDRFLTWPLPESVLCDPCASMQNYPHSRIGTNLLTAIEARQMLEHVFDVERALRAEIARLRKIEAAAVEVCQSWIYGDDGSEMFKGKMKDLAAIAGDGGGNVR